MMETSLINSRGFFVDPKTGICHEEPYFELSNKNYNIFFTPIRTKKFYITPEWRRLMRKTSQNNDIFYNVIIHRFNFIASSMVSYISLEVLEKIKTFIKTKKPKTYLELYQLIFDYVYEYDLPITTNELKKLINKTVQTSSLRNTINRYFQKIDNKNRIRIYYWFISRRLDRIPMTNEMKMQFEKIIFKYYNMVRFKLLASYNPLQLINYLVFHTIRQYGTDIPKKYKTIKFHKCCNFKGQNSKKMFEMINKTNLDRNFKYRLRLELI